MHDFADAQEDRAVAGGGGKKQNTGCRMKTKEQIKHFVNPRKYRRSGGSEGKSVSVGFSKESGRSFIFCCKIKGQMSPDLKLQVPEAAELCVCSGGGKSFR